jgi:hypothetical protein
MRFNCGRTCHFRESCRFTPALSTLRLIHSHTTRVMIEFRDDRALKAAVEALGGQWLGFGEHKLYSSTEGGNGFRLPGWTYPLVSKWNGALAYDDFHGSWGKVADLERLKGAYAIEAARLAAQDLGWYTEVRGEDLVIHHPDGGTLTVTPAGTVDAACFLGRDCLAAAAPIEAALGRKADQTLKPEYFQERAKITQTEGS